MLETLENRALLTTLLPGFTETLITTAANINRPTAMEFSPSGQLWVLEQSGAAKVVDLGTGGTSSAGTLTVNSSGERGLLGIAFPSTYDGAGPNTDHVYLYYTATSPNVHNRLSRFVVNNAGSSTPTLGAESIIMEVAPEPQGDGSSNHNGGAIHFGLDGRLYIAIGDHNADGTSFQGVNHVSQRLDYQHGKLLRIDVSGADDFPADPGRNYAIPAGNPFVSSTAAFADETYALGLRNPYTFAVQPGAGLIYINDVGEGTWEEINDGVAGANFGWASEGTPGGFAEGFESAAPSYVTVGTYRNPQMAFDHVDNASDPNDAPGACAITGGAFYPANNQFGNAYGGKYFFADYCGNFIRVFDPATPGSLATPDRSSPFAGSLTTGAPVDLKVDSNGSLYYLAGAAGANGEIYRISFNAPAITDQPDDVTVTEGQPATFTVAASGGAPLSYQWQRADSATPTTFVNVSGATAASYTLASASNSDNGDKFRCVVTNSAGNATSSAATLTVNVAGQAPAITTQPGSPSVNVGQAAQFSVVASGTAPLAYQWQRADSATPAAFANISGATGSSYTLINAQASDHNDQFRVVVSNSFGQATSNSGMLSVNQFPNGTITAPATYSFNQTIAFSATASDPEDGPLPASDFAWSVDFGHDAHFHPHVAPFGGVTGSAFVANFVEPDPDQFYRIRLTVTDSDGATFTTFQDVQPVKVQLTLASDPAGVTLTVDGQSVTGPVDSVVGSARAIGAPPSAVINGTSYNFVSWSDGGQATHTITTPSANTTYTADYTPAAAAGLFAEYYDFTTGLSTLPNLTGRTPDVTRIDAQINYPRTTSPWAGLDSRFANTFAARYTGYLRVDTAGSYQLFLNSDDGSRLWLDGQLLIDNNGTHSMRERSATRTLSGGYHQLRVEYFENAGNAGLIMSWSGPGIGKQVISAGNLVQTIPAAG